MSKELFIALSLGFAGVLAFPHVAPAQQASCAERALVVELLQARFGELRQGIGLSENNTVFEVFASSETGSWSILVTLPNGMTCLAASGENWEATGQKIPQPGEAA